MMRPVLLAVIVTALGLLAPAQASQSVSGDGDPEMISQGALGFHAVEEVGRVHSDGRIHVQQLATPGTTVIDLTRGKRHASATVTVVRAPLGESTPLIGFGGVISASDLPGYIVSIVDLRVNGCVIDFPTLEPPALGDPHGVSLTSAKGLWTLSAWGSDNSESYRIDYQFNDHAVLARTLHWGADEERARYAISREDYGEPRDCKPDGGPRHSAEARRLDAALGTSH